jgi:hypothetical protein
MIVTVIVLSNIYFSSTTDKVSVVKLDNKMKMACDYPTGHVCMASPAMALTCVKNNPTIGLSYLAHKQQHLFSTDICRVDFIYVSLASIYSILFSHCISFPSIETIDLGRRVSAFHPSWGVRPLRNWRGELSPVLVRPTTGG